jgi:hypothetical protein
VTGERAAFEKGPLQRTDASVYLSEEDLRRAYRVGGERCLAALRRSPGKHGIIGTTVDTEWGPHILGAIGEQAMSLWLDVAYDPPIEIDDLGDVGPYQIRGTHYWDGKLTFRPRDKDKGHAPSVFVLAIVRVPMVHLRGWMYGHEIEAKGVWGDPGGRKRFCWMAGQELLQPLHTLPELGQSHGRNPLWRARKPAPRLAPAPT